MLRICSFLLFSVAFALPVRALVSSARPGAGYVSRALTGGVPVGAIRGRYPGTTEPVLVREQKREVSYDGSTYTPRFTTRERQNGSMRVTESRSGTTDEFLPDDFL